jgi:hypothetical protein
MWYGMALIKNVVGVGSFLETLKDSNIINYFNSDFHNSFYSKSLWTEGQPKRWNI